MLSHFNIGSNNVGDAVVFYTNVLRPLGLVNLYAAKDGTWASWGPADGTRPHFVVSRPQNGQDCASGNGQMLAFEAQTRAAVDQCYQSAMSQGATSEGEPGLRAEYHPDFYGAYFRDTDGNKFCICCHHGA